MQQTVTKQRADAPAGFFEVEAAGLAWLGQATPSGGAAVASVREVGRGHIVLDRVTTVPPTPAAAEAFGRALAATHRAGAAAFGVPPDGWHGDGYIGRLRLPMGEYTSWGAFFADLRLLPYAGAARNRGTLDRAGLRAVESVCGRLRDGQFDDGRHAARIHGDLWAGNVLYGADGAVLIDPAAHGGHGLTDLAMLELFGLPQLPRVRAAYAEAALLPPGWPELIGLHQLHPLLVHAVTHGQAYGVEAARVARRYA